MANYFGSSISVIRDVIPGIEEARGQMQEARGFEVYPNPAKTYFVVRLGDVGANSYSRQSGLGNPSHSILKMFDVTGKVIKVEELKSAKEQRISLDGIKNGIYFVQLDNLLKPEKLIITR